MEDLEKQIEELKGIIKDYEDIVEAKDEEIEELKNTIENVQDLIYQINKII